MSDGLQDTISTKFVFDGTETPEQVRRMIAAIKRELDAYVDENIAAARKAAKAHKDAFGETNVPKAFESFFNSARLGVIDAGTEKFKLMGGAIEHLGPAGIAAAAAMAAFGFSAEQAMKAIEWAEELSNFANKVGATTDQIQELDYASAKFGVSQQVMREGIMKVTQAIGTYQSNVKDGRVNDIFKALGISKDAARQWNGPVDGLLAISDAIQKIKSRSEQLSLLQKLKVPDEMVPALLKGGDALREMMAEAKNVGAVMDHEMVERADEMAIKLKETKQVIDTQLREAFINMAPAVIPIVTLMARMATLAHDTAEFMNSIDWSKGQQNYANYSEDHLQRTIADRNNMRETIAKHAQQQGLTAKYNDDGTATFYEKGGSVNQVLTKQYNDANDTFKRASGSLADKQADDKKYANTGTTAVALAPEKIKKEKGPADETQNFNKSTLDEWENAVKDNAEANKKLATTLQKRAEDESQAIDAETNKKINDLEAERQKILASKNDKDKSGQTAVIENTEEVIRSTAALKKEEIARNLAADVIAENAKLAKAQSDGQAAKVGRESNYYDTIAQLATTTAQRIAYQKQAFEKQQERDRIQAQAEVALAQATLDEAKRRGADASTIAEDQQKLDDAKSAKDDLNKVQPMQKAAFDNSHLDTLGTYFKQSSDQANDALQSIQVKGLEGLNQGLDDALEHTSHWGKKMHEIFASIGEDIISMATKNMIVNPLGNALFGSAGGQTVANQATPSLGLLGGLVKGIFGFATGTDNAPGGLAMVGEAGPELVNLPQGSQVMPNALLRNSVAMPQGAGTQHNTYNLTTNVHADDAVMAQGIYQAIAASHQAAVKTAVTMAGVQNAQAQRKSL